MRRLHGPSRGQPGNLLHDAGGRRARARDHNDRRTGDTRPDASGAGGVCRVRRGAMRFLYAWNDHVGRRSLEAQSSPEPRRSEARGRGQYLPLRNVSACFQSSVGRRRANADRRVDWKQRLMARRLTLRLGFAGTAEEVGVVIPDDEPTPWQLGEKFTVVGTDTPRVDGPLKTTGVARYTYDIDLPGMLHGAILRSPYPHARVRSVDLTRAKRMPGVRAVLKRDDVIVRFAGQEVAAVAATSPEAASDALALITVDYESLPFVVDMEAALQPSAPQV